MATGDRPRTPACRAAGGRRWASRRRELARVAQGDELNAGLADGTLQPGYAGLRPKISGPGEAAADFRIDGVETHGVPGLVNLFGIESPGLTASLAIAERVAQSLAG